MNIREKNPQSDKSRGSSRLLAVLGLLLLCFLLGAGSLSPAPVKAAGSLMLYPTRIIFEGKTRAAHLDLINNGNETITYRISFTQRRMDEVGGFQEIDTPLPGEHFADGLVRFSPRQVTLAPGSSQIVRLMVRKPADLEAGEYRSHLLFSQVPDDKGSSILSGREKEKEFKVTLTPLIAVSIPVIVRHGQTSAIVRLSNLSLQPGTDQAPPVLSLDIERSGNRSVYGDLLVYFESPGAAEQRLGQIQGVAVYTPNLLRRIRIPLEKIETGGSQGMLTVHYMEKAEDGGRELAQAIHPLPTPSLP